ncbi:MAG: sigma-70 family RNA polymerase sigma factor [Sedimentisphaerales bacterium]|nr:sigma-70 family RNA polymerase sigma factor [Sedimentisphaerales bacterium]
MENTDKSLIEAHCKGDPTAFGEIVRRYGDGVLGYLVRMTGNREQAEDLFQETFKRVHEKSHTLRGNEFKSWLFKIATNAALDGLRKKIRVNSREKKLNFADCDDAKNAEVVAVDNSRNPSAEAEKAEHIEQVRRAVESLPDRQRATLVLAYYQQLSYRQVASVLGCSIGTVKTQMYRALRALAQNLPEIEL